MHWGQPFLCPLRAVQRKPANSKQRRGTDLREPILEMCGRGMLLGGKGEEEDRRGRGLFFVQAREEFRPTPPTQGRMQKYKKS